MVLRQTHGERQGAVANDGFLPPHLGNRHIRPYCNVDDVYVRLMMTISQIDAANEVNVNNLQIALEIESSLVKGGVKVDHCGGVKGSYFLRKLLPI